MAIPFNLPSDDTTIEQYRCIHQLLMDLTAILRGLLARNPHWVHADHPTASNASANHNNNNHQSHNNNINIHPCSHRVTAPHDCVHHQHDHQQAAASNVVQFGLPLSPPNSQPGSPSPFFTAGTPSFVLPDVVSSAARALSNMAPHQLSTAMTPGSVVAAAAATAAAPSTDEDDCAPISQRLRKRRRASKVTKRKYKPQDLDLTAANAVAPRKIPRTNNNNNNNNDSAPCSFATNDDSVADARAPTVMNQQACFSEVPRLSADECNCGRPLSQDKIPMCLHVSEELRRIVECFRCPRKQTGSIPADDEDFGNVKVSGFFTQFGRSMFTAALLVIGWKLLRQN